MNQRDKFYKILITPVTPSTLMSNFHKRSHLMEMDYKINEKLNIIAYIEENGENI